MTLRKVLIIPLLVSLLFFILYGGEIWRTALHVLDSLRIDALFIALVIVAVVLQFTGHIVRAKKASLLMDPMEHSKVSTQFRAFSIGQLFNTLLPFRIGELIRSSILSQKLNISFIYSPVHSLLFFPPQYFLYYVLFQKDLLKRINSTKNGFYSLGLVLV